MQILTKREKDCLDFIIAWVAKKNYSPKVRDIMLGIGVKSTCSPSIYVKRLEEKGYLKRGGRRQLIIRVNVLSTKDVLVENHRGSKVEEKDFKYECPICGSKIKIRETAAVRADRLARARGWSVVRQRGPALAHCPKHKGLRKD